jgi:hypothetical protein
MAAVSRKTSKSLTVSDLQEIFHFKHSLKERGRKHGRADYGRRSCSGSDSYLPNDLDV